MATSSFNKKAITLVAGVLLISSFGEAFQSAKNSYGAVKNTGLSKNAPKWKIVNMAANADEDDDDMQSSLMDFEKKKQENTESKMPAPQSQNQKFLGSESADAEAELPGIPKDAKEARVLIYIIISLIPCLFLLPLVFPRGDFLPVDPSMMQ